MAHDALKETGYAQVQVLKSPLQGRFATSLALSATTLIAGTRGAAFDADAGIWTSTVDFLERNEAGQFVPVLHAEDMAAEVWLRLPFASAVATDGPWALVSRGGASGMVLFARLDGGWVEQGSFPFATDLVVSDAALKNERVAILTGSDDSSSRSQLRFYGRKDTGWVSQGDFSTDCLTHFATCRLAISDQIAAINSGEKVTVYRRSDSGWVQDAELTPTASSATGGAVSIAGSAILSVSIPRRGGRPREVYIFQRQAGTWAQTAYLPVGETGSPEAYAYGAGAVVVAPSASLPTVTAAVAFGDTLDIYSSQGSWARDEKVPVGAVLGEMVAAGDTIVAASASALAPGSQVLVLEPVHRARLGVACAHRGQCQSGFCVDAVCCDELCGDLCQGCSAAVKGGGLDGFCEPVDAGLDPDNDCVPEPGFPQSCGADGLCDGTGACRSKAGAGTACGPSQCKGTDVVGSVCDGEGHCAGNSTAAFCAPYVCINGTCTNACSDQAACAPGARCLETNVCIAQPICSGHLITDPSGSVTDCAPYLCQPNGTCADQCSSLSDCVPPTLCNRDHRCVFPDLPAQFQSPGCGCAESRSGGGIGARALLVVVLWAFAERRRRSIGDGHHGANAVSSG